MKVKSSVSTSSGDKIDLVHLEDVQGEETQPTKKQKFQRHIKRFWFCYLLALVVFLSIFLPIL